MRLISFSPPLIVPGLVLIGAQLARALTQGSWQNPTIGDVLGFLNFAVPEGAAWLTWSPGWLLLGLGLLVGEAGLVQLRLLAVKERKMMARLRVQAEERRAKERHDDMLKRRRRRLNRILNKAA